MFIVIKIIFIILIILIILIIFIILIIRKNLIIFTFPLNIQPQYQLLKSENLVHRHKGMWPRRYAGTKIRMHENMRARTSARTRTYGCTAHTIPKPYYHSQLLKKICVNYAHAHANDQFGDQLQACTMEEFVQ